MTYFIIKIKTRYCFKINNKTVKKLGNIIAITTILIQCRSLSVIRYKLTNKLTFIDKAMRYDKGLLTFVTIWYPISK